MCDSVNSDSIIERGSEIGLLLGRRVCFGERIRTDVSTHDGRISHSSTSSRDGCRGVTWVMVWKSDRTTNGASATHDWHTQRPSKHGEPDGNLICSAKNKRHKPILGSQSAEEVLRCIDSRGLYHLTEQEADSTLPVLGRG